MGGLPWGGFAFRLVISECWPAHPPFHSAIHSAYSAQSQQFIPWETDFSEPRRGQCAFKWVECYGLGKLDQASERFLLAPPPWGR